MKRPQDITSIERLERLRQVKKIFLEGYSRSDIILFCEEKWKIKEGTVDLYLIEIRREIKEDFQKNFDKEAFKLEITARFEDLYKKNVDIDDYKECRAILNDFNKMFGLLEPEKKDITTDGEKISKTVIKWGDNEISI